MDKVLIIVLLCIGLSCSNNRFTQQSTIKGTYNVKRRSEATHARITGYVKDKETGKVLSSANISIVGNEKIGTIADKNGFFKLEIYPGCVQISVTNVGNTDLKTKPLKIGVNEQIEIEFYLGTYIIK
ncbi:MAG: carboxypeptidase-like regulatory domain-containing protein [Rhodothermia bacterium]|nr:carboxypeptidase-like regulatory domain-containing protein [Rhodothermia bacterium]